MVADQAVLSSWRSVVGALEDDARVSARLMGFVYLAQPQGLILVTAVLPLDTELEAHFRIKDQIASQLQLLPLPYSLLD